jgi:hypothetical protein
MRNLFIVLTALTVIVIGAVLIFGAGAPSHPAGEASADRIGTIDEFLAAVEADNFIVQEGKFEVFPILDMFDAGIIPSCYGNNPSTPYMVYKLPKAPGQTVPNTVTDAPINPEDAGLWMDYRLRPDEALVFIGSTPPDLDYFSYRSYIVNRWFPDEGIQRRVFASLGDTINMRTIKTAGTPNGETGNPFEEMTVIITTADRGVDARVHRALESAGYSPSIINDDIIPSGIVRMGLEKESDTFGFIHRVAFFHDDAAGAAYLNGSPGRVFRLTPNETVQNLDPYPVPPLRVRGTGDTVELDLTDDLDELCAAIRARYGDENATELVTSIWLLEGYDAIQRGVDAIGENRDTVYLRTENFTLADGGAEFLIVYGVNHAASGKATYSNFGVYGADILNGIGGVSNHDFSGTAEEYLPDNPNAKYLYVWKVARQVNGDAHCLKVPYDNGAHGIDLDEEAFIGFRAYLEDATDAGPNWFELVYDRAIKFGPQSQ